MSNLTIVVVIILVHSFKAPAQEIYKTKKGRLEIRALVKDESYNLNSQSLNMIVDYESAEFEISLPLKSVHANRELIENGLIPDQNSTFIMQGNLGIGYVNTSGHAPIPFDFQAICSYINMTKQIKGKGYLHHVWGGREYACTLGLQFELESEYFGFKKVHLFTEPLQVQIVQTLLKPFP